MPACSSSPFATVAHRLTAPAALAPNQCRSLLDHLAHIADPRQRRGRRHTLAAVLAVAVAAVLAGARSLAAIGEWTSDAPGQHPPPGPSPPGRAPHRAVAVDGKTMRGSGHHDTSQLHLLAVMDHTTCGVLGQTGVDGKANEITWFQPLPTARRHRPPRNGQPAQPRHRHPAAAGPSQHRRRAAAQCPRRHQSPTTARHHKPVKPTLRHHAGP